MNKLRLIVFSTMFLGIITSHAQNYHTYMKFDVGTGGIVSFGIVNLATAVGNIISKKILFDNYLFFNQYDIIEKGIPVSISPETTNLNDHYFDNLFTGIKLGYQSYNMSKFNWGIYGSVHYKTHIFETTLPTWYSFMKHKLHHALLGVGLLGTFGEIGSPVRIQLEAALRYEIPIYYSGPNEEGKEFLNSGCSCFLSAKYGRPTGYVNFGLFADISCYNMFKNGGTYFTKPEVKIKSFGIIFSLNLWRMIHGSGK